MIFWVLGGIVLLLVGSKVVGDTPLIDSKPGQGVTAWSRFDEAFKRIGAQYGVPWEWLKAFALNESSLAADKRVASGDTSSDGLSWGLMQVTLKTGTALDPSCTIEKLANLDPADYSIELAARVIQEDMNAFDSNDPAYIEKVVKSYNQGPYNTKQEFNGVVTQYTDDVQAYWERWQRNLARAKGIT